MVPMTVAVLALTLVVRGEETPVPSPLVRADEAFAHREYAIAERLYDSLLQRSPGDAELLWRSARLSVCMGDVAGEQDRLAFYQKAEQLARRSCLADSLNAHGYTWRAAALGNLAMFEGSSKKVELAHEIKSLADRAVALDSTDDIAWSLMGSFYRALGGVSWIERQLANLLLGGLPDGGYAESEHALLHAVQIAPTVVRHRHELGLLYLDMDRPDDAQAQFEKVVGLAPLLASDQRRIEESREWITEHARK